MLQSKISKGWLVIFLFLSLSLSLSWTNVLSYWFWVLVCLFEFLITPSLHYCRSELPQDQYEPLRLELFRVILRFSGGPRLVLTRLCVAMVMYMFHAVPDLWPNAVVSSIQTLQSAQTTVSKVISLFGLLSYLLFIGWHNEHWLQSTAL